MSEVEQEGGGADAGASPDADPARENGEPAEAEPTDEPEGDE